MTILNQKTRPLCKICNKAPAAENGTSKNGFIKYRSVCNYCKTANRSDYLYKSYKKDTCDKCGFIAEHRCQLDVDHIDGNKNNNSTENLQTLCSNCHRLKTLLEGDNSNIKYR